MQIQQESKNPIIWWSSNAKIQTHKMSSFAQNYRHEFVHTSQLKQYGECKFYHIKDALWTECYTIKVYL